MASLALFSHQSAGITQSSNKSYGIDTSNVNKFRVSSIFNVAGSVQAYTMVSGTILLQQQTGIPTKVNLILKPHDQDNLKLPVKYIVYRGLETSDFIDNNNLTDPNNKVKTSGSELLDAMQAIQQQRAPADDIPIEALFGNDLAPLNTKNIDEFFFKNLATTSQLFTIDCGVGLGNFATGEVSIEIILENPEYTLTVEDAKKVIHEIDVTGITNAAEKRWKQDIVRHFVDAAAYYGLHHDIKGGIEYRNASGKQSADTAALVYSQIVDKFLTKNKVYLDVRNENGYSYNYYGNYVGTGVDAEKNIRIGQTAASMVAEEYNTNGWAIHTIDVTPGSGSENEIFVALLISDNTKPLLAGWNIEINPFTKVDPSNSANRVYYVDETILLFAPSGGFTSPFSFKVPNISGSTSAQLSTIVRLDYNKQAVTSTFTTFALTGTTDYYFGTAILNLLWDTEESVIWHTDNFKKFVESAEDIGFSGYIETGHILDNSSDENILLYVAPENYFIADAVEKKISFNRKGGSADLGSFINLFADVSLERTNLSLSVSEDVLSFSFTFDNTLKRVVQVLGITKTEWDTTINNVASTLSDNHIKLIKLNASGTQKTDLNGTIYNDYEIAVTGMDSLGTMQEVGTGLTVYTTDNLIFSTKAFTDNYQIDYTEAEQALEKFLTILDPAYPLTAIPNFFEDIPTNRRSNEEIDNLQNSWIHGVKNKNLFFLDDTMKDKVSELKTALDNVQENYTTIETLIEQKGADLLNYAKQRIKEQNEDYTNKDGILYLTRLMMQVVLKNHPKLLTKFPSQITKLSNTFEKHSRGLEGTEKPTFSSQPTTNFNVLVSGYDPFSGGVDWQDHVSNPSGNISLILDNESFSENGKECHIKSVIFPVRYHEFNAGWIEDFFQPYINDNSINMIITFSYGGAVYFNIDRFASRYRKPSHRDNNDRLAGSSLYLNQEDKNAYEFIETTLPYDDLIAGGNGKIILHQRAYFEYYNDDIATGEKNYSISTKIYPPLLDEPTLVNYPPPSGTTANSIKAFYGSGGDYLSNEIYYRVAFLREMYSVGKLTGHIHMGFNKSDNESKNDRGQMKDIIINALKTVISNL